jgi:hypothetical protein
VTRSIRYYVKHPAINNYQHSGIWMGGYNPPLAWPNPQAGTKPAGNDRFSASAEQNDWNFDHYDYWMGMHLSNDGNYWGDHLLNDPSVQARAISGCASSRWSSSIRRSPHRTANMRSGSTA